MTEKCPRCGGEMDCLSGHSAHPLNWYCEDKEGCGYQAWNRDTHAVAAPVVMNEDRRIKILEAKIEQLEGKQKYHNDAIQNMRLACDMRIEQLETAITKYRRFVGTLECTNANCGLGSMKCSVCRIKDEPPEDKI